MVTTQKAPRPVRDPRALPMPHDFPMMAPDHPWHRSLPSQYQALCSWCRRKPWQASGSPIHPLYSTPMGSLCEECNTLRQFHGACEAPQVFEQPVMSEAAPRYALPKSFHKKARQVGTVTLPAGYEEALQAVSMEDAIKKLKEAIED